MSAAPIAGPMNIGYPRYFKILGYSINSYKLFLCVGIYVGTLATAALASSSELSPLNVGLAALTCGLLGFVGARMYYVLVHAPVYLRQRSVRVLWNSSEGGWSVFGALLTFAPATFAAAAWLDIPVSVFWDHLGIGILASGFWIRLGCVFNGCCAGRVAKGRLGVRLHDTSGVIKPRMPVQFLEMAWWFLGLVAFLALWPAALPPGSYALAVLAWYGVGRFFLEPLRERPEVVFGRIPIDRVVAAILAITTGGALILRGWAG